MRESTVLYCSFHVNSKQKKTKKKQKQEKKKTSVSQAKQDSCRRYCQ